MEVDVKKINEVETLEVVKSCVVRETGATKGRHCKPGDKVKLSGPDKVELMVRNMVKPIAEKK